MCIDPIKVTYKVARSAFKASQFLDEIKQADLFAADFEASVKYTPEQRQAMQAELDTNPSKLRAIQLRSALDATALDHPSHCTLTHLSIATNDHSAYVFILDNRQITNLVLEFLVTTPIKQVWHNASYDFKHLLYHTGRMPLNYEDTQIFAKCLVNHVDTYKANTGLKELCGSTYGAWSLSSDNFDLSHMYDETMLQYAAIDSAATFWLYNKLLDYVAKNKD